MSVTIHNQKPPTFNSEGDTTARVTILKQKTPRLALREARPRESHLINYTEFGNIPLR